LEERSEVLEFVLEGLEKGVFAKPSRKFAYSSQEFRAFDIQNPKIDNIVLIKDDNIPRCCW